MKKIIVSVLLWPKIISTDCAIAKTIMEASTEEVSVGEVTPPQALVDSILVERYGSGLNSVHLKNVCFMYSVENPKDS